MIKRQTPPIRRAKLGELSDLQRIEKAASSLFPSDRLPESDRPVSLRTLRASLSEDLIWVALSDHGQIAGFAFASSHACDSSNDQAWRLHLEELDVHPQHMRQGIGSALLLHVINEAQQRDYEAVTLTTFSDIAWNAPFYARFGFAPVTQETSHSLLDSILIKEQLLGLTQRIAMILPLSHRVDRIQACAAEHDTTRNTEQQPQ